MSLSNFDLIRIADNGLRHYMGKMAPLTRFVHGAMRDMSGAPIVAALNDKVQVPHYKKAGVAEAYDSASDHGHGGTGYSTTGALNVAGVDVTLDTRLTSQATYTDAEVSGKNIDWDAVIAKLADELFALTIQTVLGHVVAANYTFSAAALTGAASTFAYNDFDALHATLNGRKVARDGRFMLLDPAYMDALAQDTTIVGANILGNTEGIQEGRFTRLGGFDMYESFHIPGNSVNMVGVYGRKDAILWATGMIDLTDNARAAGVRQEIAVDPETGISFSVRFGYDQHIEKNVITVGNLFGVETGEADEIDFIASA